MKNKCPHCGSLSAIDPTSNRMFFACGSYQAKGFQIHRSDTCLERDEVNRLTEERDAWKDAAIALRELLGERKNDNQAAALYVAAAEKYGI